MKLEKAIEILNEHKELVLVDKNPDLKDAIRLGIEAMKLVQRERILSINPVETILPGETPPGDSP